jgi:hypothetical protein
MRRNISGIGFYTATLLMIATAVAGAAPGSQDQNPSQAGKSSIYFYDVAATDTHGKGKLMIDLAKHTFEFNGQDFAPSSQVELRARAAASDDYVLFATGKATPSGNLHLAGTWEAGAAAAEVVATTSYELISGFSLMNWGGFVARLACYYSTDGGVTWTESGHTDDITLGKEKLVNLDDYGVPADALVKIHVIVVAGKDRTGSQVFKTVYYPSGPMHVHTYADYNIYGTTWNPYLEYDGLDDIVW